MEVWEAMYRSMLESYLDSLPNKQRLEQSIASTLQEFENVNYDELDFLRKRESILMNNLAGMSRKCQTKMTLGSSGAGLFLRTADHIFHYL